MPLVKPSLHLRSACSVPVDPSNLHTARNLDNGGPGFDASPTRTPRRPHRAALESCAAVRPAPVPTTLQEHGPASTTRQQPRRIGISSTHMGVEWVAPPTKAPSLASETKKIGSLRHFFACLGHLRQAKHQCQLVLSACSGSLHRTQHQWVLRSCSGSLCRTQHRSCLLSVPWADFGINGCFVLSASPGRIGLVGVSCLLIVPGPNLASVGALCLPGSHG